MPLKRRAGQNTENATPDSGAAPDSGAKATPPSTGMQPLQLNVTPKEHFIAQQANRGRDLMGTNPAHKDKTDAERLAIGTAVLEVLRDPTATPQEMIARLRQTEEKLEAGAISQEVLDEVGAPTADDVAKLTQLLGTEPDDNEMFTYLVSQAAVQLDIAKEASQPAHSLGNLGLISSNYDVELPTYTLDSSVEDLVAFPELLSTEQANRLYIALRHAHSEVGIGQAYGADFDVSQEIGEQITVVKAMRARLIDADGKLNARFSAKEAKEILGASNALNQTIMKFQKEITNFQRLIMVENAVKAALDTLPREAQERYLEVLTEQLAASKK